MKLLHLGDLHLGRQLGEYNLIDDQRYILDRILDIVEQRRVDAVLIAGDVYDKADPSEQAMVLLDEFLSRLSASGAATCMISGNHDSDDRLNFGSRLFEKNNIYISSVYNGSLKKQTFRDGYGDVHVYMLPFVKASMVRHCFPDAGIENYEDAVRVALENTDINTSARNILIAHQFVTGRSEEVACGGSESPATLNVGTIEKVGYDCFDAFDYVALGHIHSPQKVGREEVRYSGSILKYSVDEACKDKSVPLITLGEKGKVDIELIPLRPMRDLRHLKGRMKDLLDPANVVNEQDYIYMTLTDEDAINEAMGIVRGTYPKCVKLDYDNSRTREIEDVDISRLAVSKSFDELIGDFYRMIYGSDISDEEMEVLKEAAKEAGIENEAD